MLGDLDGKDSLCFRTGAWEIDSKLWSATRLRAVLPYVAIRFRETCGIIMASWKAAMMRV
jgi:hypothetical protein